MVIVVTDETGIEHRVNFFWPDYSTGVIYVEISKPEEFLVFVED